MLRRRQVAGRRWGNVAILIAAQAAEIEALRAEVAECKRVSAAKGEAEIRAERLEKALKDIRGLSSISSAMNPNPFALTAVLAEIHYIADTALAKEKDNEQ